MTPRKPRDLLLALYVLVCLFAVCWPGYALFGNSIEPYVLGVPFSLAWVVGWVLLSFFAVLAYHVACERDPETGD